MYILDDMWFGNVGQSDRFIRKGSQFAKLSKQSNEYLEEFRQELSAEGKQAYENYYNAQMELADISEKDTFIRGIRLGARLMLDILGENRSQLPQPWEEETAG